MQKEIVRTYNLGGDLYLKMLSQGCARLGKNRQAINDLNVFPIPDGDTGDNMCLTLEAGYAQASPLHGASLCEIANAVSSGMLMGARGNSGVILSRIFAGLAKGLTGLKETDTAGFAAAMASAVTEAYSSVSKPVEGTILTVVREGADSAAPYKKDSMENYISALTHAMEDSLEKTPDKLQVLKEAGVVDSGGAGLLQIFYGFQDALLGIEEGRHESAGAPSAPRVDLSAFDENTELEFGYCTEFLLRLQSSKVNLDSFDEKEIEDYILSAGDSVVFFREGSIIKVHVHTKKPGDILNRCQQWGEFLTLKIENMTLQHHNSSFAPKQEEVKRKDFGIVTVANGSGLVDAFKTLGADYVVEGGQTMNPSVADFIAAFDAVKARNIFVFPNNSNIVMTARQAADIYTGAHVLVVPTKDLGAGYVAIASLDTSAGDPESIAECAEEIASGVVCGLVSPASRDTVKDGMEVHKGGYIGFRGSEVLSSGDERFSTALDLLGSLDAGEHDVVIVFTGADVPEEESQAFCSAITAAYPSTEIIFNHGGQAVYDYTFILC